MQIELAYGAGRLAVELPGAAHVKLISPQYLQALPDPPAALRQALRAPLGLPALQSLVAPGERVGIIFSDITRPTPNHLILPVVLDELAQAGISDDEIRLFNALGTHRPNTAAELSAMLGAEIPARYRIIQNKAFDPASQVRLGGTSRGNAIWLNRELVDCDFLILTGFIEPHFFAGFSGGGKAVMPGMAGLGTIMANHAADMIAHPKATWGITHGNPIWEEVMEAASMLAGTFLLNVTLNKDQDITAVFAGDLFAAHAAGCQFAKRHAMVPLDAPCEIVITSNSGYPLDQNLYQAVKGMSAAAQIVKPGGTIIIAAECRDGLPEHGLYRELLSSAASPQALLETIQAPGFHRQDQWQVQIQALIQQKARVLVYSDYLSAEQIRAAQLEPCRDIGATVAGLWEQYGPAARIGVLPEGPQTIPYLAG